jgi:hypothetical protein
MIAFHNMDKKMARLSGWLIVASLSALPTTGAAQAIAGGSFWLELRPRWNHIEESDKPEAAEGGTVRMIAGWRSAPWHGLRLTLEGIHADHWGEKHFNDDPANIPISPYPLLPDPRHTGVNRAFVEYAHEAGLSARLGRQRVELDNERWVSDNDFRQVPQLFDGVALEYAGLASTRLAAGYYSQLRSTSGKAEDIRLTVVNAAWNPMAGHTLGAFAYLHDQPNTAPFTGFQDESCRVLGARAEGIIARWGEVELPYIVELARQRPYADGDARIEARYWRVGAGLSTGRWMVRADYEVRGSNDGLYGLQIPLTDFYRYNGWTLKWFTNAREGLRDAWVTGRLAIGRVTLYAETHRFESDFGGLDFGRELDAAIAWEIVPSAVLRLQHARYDSGSGRDYADIRKTWLTLTYAYP